MKQSLATQFWFALVMCAALLGAKAFAQTVNIYGSLGNFDIANDTGHDAHGFEVELEGVQSNQVTYTFSYQRYGNASIISMATGTIVRWTSSYDSLAQRFNQTTIARTATGSFQGTCYMGTAAYNTSGCEHFGVSLAAFARPTRTTHRWLLADPANPGMLLGNINPSPIPMPTYTIVPPVREGEPAEIEAEIEAPEPPEAPELYGDAQWVKVFKTQLNRAVNLDELVSTNPIVPQNAAQVEVEWDILQAEPASNGNRRRHRNQGALDPTTRSVIRRYEIYRYTGAYDPVTHQAVCADLTCTAPAANELGAFVSAQMAAVNVEPNALVITKTGNGDVDSSDRIIACGSQCTATYNLGSVVNLTVKPNKSVFVGWTGACTGTAVNCTVTVNGETNVGAVFAQMFNLSVKSSGKGGVVSDVPGIGCGTGGSCSAKFASGSIVTLTATPKAGQRFSNWSGACTGSTPTCTLTVNKDTSVQAVFVK